MPSARPRTHAAALPAALLAVLFTTPGLRAQDAPAAKPEAQNPDGPFTAAEVTRKAVVFVKPEPGFTERARRKGTRGVVRLRVVFSRTGEVTDISVLQGLPNGLTENAVKAARRIKFRPALKDGEPVSQWVTLEYNFQSYLVGGEVTREAVILERPAPEYTEEARRLKVEGKVVLEVSLNKDGTVSAKVVQGLPHGLSEKALEAARKIRFAPALHKGKRVSAVQRVEYVFSLD